MSTNRAVDRSLHPHPSVAVIVDAVDERLVDGPLGEDALSRTLEGLDELVGKNLVHEVLVVAVPRESLGSVRVFVPIAGEPGGAFADALAKVSAEVVVHLTAGLVPTAEWLSSLLDGLEQAHGAAVVAPVVDEATGEPWDRPVGLSLAGHPLTSVTGTSAPDDDRTMFLGPAWAAPRLDLVDIGGFDPQLAPPFLLIDLGWRFWLAGAGARVVAAAAIAGWRPEPRSSAADAVRRETDALITLYRNFDDASLGAALPAALVLSPLRVASNGVAPEDRDVGVRAFLDRLDDLAPERAERQALRRRPDAEIMGVLRDPLRPDCLAPAFVATHRSLVGALPGGHRFGGRYRIVVATRDSLAPRMAGPGIRAWNIARELARDHDVRLVSLTHASLTDDTFSIEHTDERGIAALVEWCDVFVFQGWVMADQACFERDDRIFVADVYDPMHLEQLEQAKDDGEHNRRRAVSGSIAILNEQLERGDFFLCASEKQRDFWLGHLASLGRINAATYDADESMRSQIAVVPFGVPDHRPERTRSAIKGVLPGVGVDDPVILWGGGVYNWFDPLTLIQAVDHLRTRIPDVKLVFLGMRHPNAEIPEMRMAVEARRLAADLGLVGSTVIFNEEWVAYDDRHNYLLDADVAVTTHLHHIETEFSFRTRVLDYFWAGLPTVATSGDALADLIEHEQLGLTVPPNDVDALEDALFRLLDDQDFAAECRERVDLARAQFAWPVALRPLVEFCRTPRRAPDLVAELVDARGVIVDKRHQPPSVYVRYKTVVVDLVRDGDWHQIARSSIRVARRLLTSLVRPAR